MSDLRSQCDVGHGEMGAVLFPFLDNHSVDGVDYILELDFLPRVQRRRRYDERNIVEP